MTIDPLYSVTVPPGDGPLVAFNQVRNELLGEPYSTCIQQDPSILKYYENYTIGEDKNIDIFYQRKYEIKNLRSLLSRVHGRPVEGRMQMRSTLLRFSFCKLIIVKSLTLLCFIKKVVKDSKTRPQGFGESNEDHDQEIAPFGSMQLVFHESFRISIIQNVAMRRHPV